MGKYARGKKSYAISDISGLRVKYTKLKTTWDGLRVSPEDYEPKHPQLETRRNLADPEALNNPRVDTSVVPSNFTVYTNWDLGIIGTALTVPDALESALGTVTVTNT